MKTLPGDVYRELQDIVGKDNISDDLAVLEVYSFQSMIQFGPKAEHRFWKKPGAVLLPGSAEEVQSIVKLCNRCGIKYRGSSTGYGNLNSLDEEGMLFLDLRRMNRILDIDEKNMIIVVEPYVTFAQVQAEAMKRGLNCHVIGAGSQPSYLASLTSVHGNNTMAISQGFSGRNLLGVEWVMPTGEITRLGSLGAGSGWFSADGPGPSLRGIIRGSAGAYGAMGVFTKCAGHLHPWAGPSSLEVKGVSPYYEVEMPEFFDYHIIEFPDWDKCADAQYKIGESGIAFAMHKTGGPGSHGSVVTGNNNEYYEKWQAGGLRVPEISFAIVLIGNSEKEFQFQDRVLRKILEETEGNIVEFAEEPSFKNRDILNMIRGCFIPRLAFRTSGNFDLDMIVGMDTIDHTAMSLEIDTWLKDKWAKTGCIMDDTTYNSWAVTWEGGHMAHHECGHLYDPLDQDSIDGKTNMMLEGKKIAFSKPLAVAWMAMGPLNWEMGPLCNNFHHWLGKIKQTFDPNTVSDPSNYLPPEGQVPG